MLSRQFVALIALLSCGSITAQVHEDLTGSWIWSVEGQTALVINLTAGPTRLYGTMRRPSEFRLTTVADTWVLTDIALPVVTFELTDMGEGPDGIRLQFSAVDSDRSGDFMLRKTDDSSAILALNDNPASPRLKLRRPRPETEVAVDWDEGRSYVLEVPPVPSNTELADIYAADQTDRQLLSDTDWTVVAPRDRARRERVREMLDSGQIRSGGDYLYAAVVYQHGSEPEDYLLAHALAMVAQAKGKAEAASIAATSLDWFLGAVERPQIFGTRYYYGAAGEPLKQDPFNRELLTDAMRTAVGVPTLKQQEVQGREMMAPQEASPAN